MQEVHEQPNDFIDIKAILSVIWDKRKILLMCLVGVSVLFWLLMLGRYFYYPKTITYSKQIQLAFSGVEKDTYPNGTPFSVSDLIAPAILNQVYEKNKLGDFKLSQERFLQAFNVETYSPERDLILKKYKNVAEQKNVTSAELAEAQEKLKNELKRSAITGAKIYFLLPEALNFPKSLAQKALRDIPQTWASFAVEKRGVLKLDMPLYSEKTLDSKAFLSLDYLIMDDLLRERVGAFQINLQALLRFPNGNVVQDDQTGLTVPELQRAVHELEHYDIAEVMVPIRSLAIARQPDVVKAFFEGQLKELTWQRDELVRKADVVQETYRTYTQQEVNRTAELPSREGVSAEMRGSTTTAMPQISEGVLDKLMKLSGQAVDLEYRQKLSSQRIEYLEKASTLEASMERIKRSIALLNGKSVAESAVRKAYVERTEQKIPEIIGKLKSYVHAAENIAKRLSIENFGYTGLLFKDSGSPIQFVLNGGLPAMRSLLWYTVALLVALFIVVPVLLLREMWSE